MHRWCAPDEYKIHQRHFTYTCSLVLTACSGYKDKFCLLKKTVHCDPSHFWLVFFHSFSTLEHPIPLLLFPLEILHWREMPLQKYIKKNEYRLFSRVISIKSANRMRQNSEIRSVQNHSLPTAYWTVWWVRCFVLLFKCFSGNYYALCTWLKVLYTF